MIRKLAAIILGLSIVDVAHAATITIIPGAGFSDTTAVTPVGGNTATTLGAARLQLFQRAADLWGSKLTSPQVIYVSAVFKSLTCSTNQGLLGQTAPNGFFKNFANAPQKNVYYPEALAFALANKRIDGSDPTANPADADMLAEFNSAVDSDPSCLHGNGFYYGLDNNPSGNKIDLLNIVMHEFAHGLGFTSFVDETTGVGFDSGNPNQLGIYDQFVYDETQGKFWPQLTAGQRVNSAINDGKLVWNGANVNGAVSHLTIGVTSAGHVELYAPNPDEPGSSVSHWSDIVAPHLLMEPFDSPTVKATVGVDFTICALADIGWPMPASMTCPDDGTVEASIVSAGASSSSSSGGGGAMPNLLWFLIPVGLRQFRRFRASRH